MTNTPQPKDLDLIEVFLSVPDKKTAMKKIIKHVFYKTQCQFCGTEFAFEKSDIYNQVTADKKKIMPFTECPQCGKRTPANTNEQIEINEQKNRLPDNEVKEIAKMQQQIDIFQHALLHLARRISHGNKCNLVYTGILDDIDRHHIDQIIKFIDQHLNDKQNRETHT